MFRLAVSVGGLAVYCCRHHDEILVFYLRNTDKTCFNFGLLRRCPASVQAYGKRCCAAQVENGCEMVEKKYEYALSGFGQPAP